MSLNNTHGTLSQLFLFVDNLKVISMSTAVDTISFTAFLESTPPYTKVSCTNFFNQNEIRQRESKASASSSKITYGQTPIDLSLTPKLYCGNETCKSYQLFEMLHNSDSLIQNNAISENKLCYRCRNCKNTTKTFFVRFEVPALGQRGFIDNQTPIQLEKIGEFPRFGKQLPNSVSKLLGSQRDLFFKGSICENQGMGIGAFSYYRRVVDSQKNKIFDKLIKALELNSDNSILIQELTDAKQETQFTKAIDRISTALPDSLNISGQNPLILLYRALSEGLHVDTDEECLQYAQAIKVVLFEFSDRLDAVLKQDQMICNAVSLLTKKTARN